MFEYEKVDLGLILFISISILIFSFVFFRIIFLDISVGKKLVDYIYNNKWNNWFIDNIVIFYNFSSLYSKSFEKVFFIYFK